MNRRSPRTSFGMGRCREVLGHFQESFPLTGLGLLAIFVTLLGTWWVGVGKSDMIVLLAGYSVLVLLLACLFAVLLGAFLLRRQLKSWVEESTSTDLSLDCGTWQASGFRLRWYRWLPFLQCEVRWTNPDIDAEISLRSSGRYLDEAVRARQRGRLESISRLITVRDSLGISAISWRFRQPQTVWLEPPAGHGRQRMLLPNLVAGEDFSSPLGDPNGDRVDMRQYSKGDSPKTILWKVFARSRKLMVKVPEKAVAARPRACAYLPSMAGDEAAAGLARDIVERNLLGDGWRFGADGTPGHSSGAAESLRTICSSGQESARQQPSGLARFLHEAAQAGYGSCLVLLGTGRGQKQTEVLAAVAASRMRIVLCLAVEGVDLRSQGRWQRWLYGSERAPRPDLDALEALCANWGRAGRELRLVDRSSGGVYRDLAALTQTLRSRTRG